MLIVFSKSQYAALRSLRHRDFRVLWLGLSVSAIGTWMQIIGQSLLVLKITHGSAVSLGFVSLAQALAFFVFALIGGGIADRIDRRRLLLTTQSALALLALTLGVLSAAGSVRVWMVVLIAFLSGTLLSFDQPARASLVSSLVPKEDLLNAISLQSMVFNGAGTAGPALAGVVTYAFGLPANFFLNALSFVAVIVALSTISLPKMAAVGQRPKLLAQVVEALRFVKRDEVLPRLLFSYGVLLFFGPSLQLLLPVMDDHVLHKGARVLGLLFSAAGIGSILGAAGLAASSTLANSRNTVRIALISWAASISVVAFSRNIVLTFGALVCLGLSQSVIGSLTMTALQTRGPREQRGRAASLNTLLMMGIRPLGDFPAAAAIALFGAPATAFASGIIVATASAIALWRRPTM
jgi:MFS family permease